MFRKTVSLFRRSLLIQWKGALAGLLCLALAGPAQAQVSDGLQRDIQAAIDRAVRLLQSRSAGDSGRESVAAVALLKSGLPADNATVQAAVNSVLGHFTGNEYRGGQHHIYEAGVNLMALANADKVRYKPQIEAISRFIIANQGPNGDWDYVSRTQGDTSISQYAMLGLWEAERAGVQVPLRVWDLAAQWHVTRQVSDGGFTYHPQAGQAGISTHSMTVAGLGTLFIARRHLYPDAVDRFRSPAAQRRTGNKKFGFLEPVELAAPQEDPLETDRTYVPTLRLSALDAAIERSLRWIELHFTVDQPSGWPIYYLYALERASALADRSEYAEHDWYEEGARHLVQTQRSDGAWNDQSGDLTATAFGVLFLTRATSKMLGRTHRDPRFGTGLLAGGRGLPENLAEVAVSGGRVEARELQGPFDELLAQLENPGSENVAGAQAAIIENVQLDRQQLVGQTDRLIKLVEHPSAEVRRTAVWALGRGGDLRLARILLGVLDNEQEDPDVWIEARNGLRILSRRLEEFGQPDPPDAAGWKAERAKWRKWYLSFRPYDERDRLDR